MSDHVLPFRPDWEPEEWPLPCERPPDGLDPWLRDLARLDGEAARDVLEGRWRGITSPGVVRLREAVLGYVPRSLVRTGDEARLAMRRHRGGLLYLGEPPEASGLDRALEAWGFAAEPAMREFFASFPRLSQLPPGLAGEFGSPPEWEAFGDFGWSDDGDEFGGWVDAPVVLNALNGDLLLLKPTGESAWGVLARGAVAGAADSFEALMGRVAACLEAGEVIDSYSPTFRG